MSYEPAGVLCPKCGGSMFSAGLYKGGYIIGGIKCVNCGEVKHHLMFGGHKSYPHKTKEEVMAKKKNDKKSKGKKVSKVSKAVGLLLALCLFAVPAMAADVFQFSGTNLSGDTLYLPSSGSFAVGVGTDLATVYDFVTIRAEYVDPMEDGIENKVGGGIGVNISALVSKLGGVWLLSGVNASIGVQALTDLEGDAHIEPALYISVINILK